jgi:hypothetical protein
VHPLRQLGPVVRRAVVDRGRDGFVAGQQRRELRVVGRAQLVRERHVEVASEREHGARQRQDHQATCDHHAAQLAELALQLAAQQPPAEIALLDRRVDRGADLRLQPRLLVQPDLEVRQHDPLCASRRVLLEALALVAGERLAQVALAIGRLAGGEAIQEQLECRRVCGHRRVGVLQVAREVNADLGEDLAVAVGHGVACALEGVKRGVQVGGQAPQPRLALEEPPADQPPPKRRERMRKLRIAAELALKLVDEVLAPDRGTRLPRGPGRIRAPIRARGRARRHRCRQLRVALGDLEVADHRVLDRCDPLCLGDVEHGVT